MSKLLTIVVPVYKVEQYINKCLDSCIIYTTDENGNRVLDEELMNQLEVIIVNDGTPDNSAELSREYTIRYPQTFRQMDKENGGHGSAWNVGVKEATGKYLRFLDSDDWLTNLDLLMKKLQDCEADLVFTQMNKFYAETGLYVEECVIDDYDIMKSIDDFNFEINNQTHILDFWHTTYKKDVLKYERDIFLENTMYDDGILFVLPAIKSSTYLCLNLNVYNYYIGRVGQSLGQEKQPRNIRARYAQCIYMYDFLNKFANEVSEKMQLNLRHINAKFAEFIFGDFIILPYKECKKYSLDCTKCIEIVDKTKHSSIWNRYKKLPFFIYYILEWVRYFKNKKISK